MELTGSNEQNPTFDLPCRDVLQRQKAIEVVGPVEAVEVEAAKVHEDIGIKFQSGAEYESGIF